MATIPNLLGRKVGMTRYFMADGKNIPVTIVKVGPCTVTQVKTVGTDGYAAVQIGMEDIKPRRSSLPLIAHDAKAGTAPKRFHREFRCKDDAEAGSFTAGQVIDVSAYEGVKFVDVIGTSKGTDSRARWSATTSRACAPRTAPSGSTARRARSARTAPTVAMVRRSRRERRWPDTWAMPA